MSSLPPPPPPPPQDHPVNDNFDWTFLFDTQEMDGLGFLDGDQCVGVPDSPVQPPPPPPPSSHQYDGYIQEYHNDVDDVAALNHYCAHYNYIVDQEEEKSPAAAVALQPSPETQTDNEQSNYVALADSMRPDQLSATLMDQLQFPPEPSMEYLDNGALSNTFIQPSPPLLLPPPPAEFIPAATHLLPPPTMEEYLDNSALFNTFIQQPPPPPPASENGRRPSKKIKRWSIREHVLFLIGLRDYQNNWIRISSELLPTRCPNQIASHAQKYFIRQQENRNLNAVAVAANVNVKTRKKRTSIHDIAIQHLPDYLHLIN